jgi:hypothetical protein
MPTVLVAVAVHWMLVFSVRSCRPCNYEVSPRFHVDYVMPPYNGTDHRQFDLNDF